MRGRKIRREGDRLVRGAGGGGLSFPISCCALAQKEGDQEKKKGHLLQGEKGWGNFYDTELVLSILF